MSIFVWSCSGNLWVLSRSGEIYFCMDIVVLLKGMWVVLIGLISFMRVLRIWGWVCWMIFFLFIVCIILILVMFRVWVIFFFWFFMLFRMRWMFFGVFVVLWSLCKGILKRVRRLWSGNLGDCCCFWGCWIFCFVIFWIFRILVFFVFVFGGCLFGLRGNFFFWMFFGCGRCCG